jgi:LysR family transcriptional activator of nhaA
VNYKHLYYFMQIAKLGGVKRASEQLHVTPQTISGQVQLLEDSLGSALFQRSGRGVALTEVGRLVLGYAEEIFSTGAELEEAVREHAKRGPRLEFRVGVSDAVPKSIACRLIEPATRLQEQVRIVCHEWKIDSLLAGLALHRLDLVISDAPIPSSVSVRAFSHRLGASGITFFAAPALLKDLVGPFPQCLEGAPMLMPGEDSALGRRLRSWFETRSLHPNVVGEFDDRALAEEFARRGAGVLVGPSVLSTEVEKQYGVKPVGVAAELEDEFYAISIERRIRHPCVAAITESARTELLAVRPKPRRASAR